MKQRGSMRHGRFIHSFDWPSAQQRWGGPVWPALALAYSGLNKVADAGLARRAELASDPNYSEVGRRNQLQAWFRSEAADAVRKAAEARALAEREVREIRGKLTLAKVDKSDVAAAVVRSDLRAWLREMKPAQRSALIITGELPLEARLAVLEAPPQLSGFTQEQWAAIEQAEIREQHPEAVEQMTAVNEALEALDSALRGAELTLREDVGVARADLDAALGIKSVKEQIAEALEGQQGPAAEPSDQAAEAA